MDDLMIRRLEDATGIAFEQYRKRHPNIAQCIEESSIFKAVVKSIQADPEARAALEKAAMEKSRFAMINRMLDLVTDKLPTALALLGA